MKYEKEKGRRRSASGARGKLVRFSCGWIFRASHPRETRDDAYAGRRWGLCTWLSPFYPRSELSGSERARRKAPRRPASHWAAKLTALDQSTSGLITRAPTITPPPPSPFAPLETTLLCGCGGGGGGGLYEWSWLTRIPGTRLMYLEFRFAFVRLEKSFSTSLIFSWPFFPLAFFIFYTELLPGSHVDLWFLLSTRSLAVLVEKPTTF